MYFCQKGGVVVQAEKRFKGLDECKRHPRRRMSPRAKRLGWITIDKKPSPGSPLHDPSLSEGKGFRVPDCDKCCDTGFGTR